MGCCHYFAQSEGGDTAFSVEMSAITFGKGVLAEAGDHAKTLGIGRIALMTDPGLSGSEHVAIVKRSLVDAGIDVAIYDEARVEPTDESFRIVTRFAEDGRFDGYISVGGGSVIDTAKGANPWSDLGCREALSIIGRYLVRAVNDAQDHEAREQLMWAATLAGIAFGNAGVHAPHGMSYAVSGLVRDFCPEGYPKIGPLVPHGMSVIVNAPSVFQFTAPACPDRHLAGAGLLGSDLRDATDGDAGEVLAGQLISLMQATQIPNGLSGVGYTPDDVTALTEGAYPQRRLLDNAPCEIGREQLSGLFETAMSYW